MTPEKIEQFKSWAKQQGKSDAEINSFIQSKMSSVQGQTFAPKPQPTLFSPIPQPEEKSVGGFAGNILKSGGNLIKDTVSAIVNPIDTIKGVGKVALGGVEKLVPGRQGAEDQFDALTNFYKERYGSIDAIKETAYNDPVGFALDASMVLGGAGAGLRAAGKVGQVGRISQVGNVVSKVGRAVDPINAATKTVGLGVRAAKEILGTTTGAGYGAIQEGLTAATRGGAAQKAFTGSLRNSGTGEEILKTTNSALDDLFEQRRTAYQGNLETLNKDTYRTKNGQLYIRKELSPAEASKTKGYAPGSKVFVPTKLTVKGLKDIATQTFKEIGIDAKTGVIDFTKRPSLDANNLQKLSDLVYQWDDITPAGLNQLRQEVVGFRKGGINLSPADNRFNLVVDRMGTGLKTYLEKRVPQIGKLNSKYAEQSDFINTIRKELSVGDGKSVDTGIRKLTSAMRQNNELRLDLIKQLQQKAGGEITSSIAGSALNPILPRGIIKPIIAGGGVLGGITFGAMAQALPFLLLASPRVVGEFLNVLGTASRISTKAKLPQTIKGTLKAINVNERTK